MFYVVNLDFLLTMCFLGFVINAFCVQRFALSICVRTLNFAFCLASFMLLCFLPCLDLFLLCGDIETNPGPTRTCPKCCMLNHVRKIVCSQCGYIVLKSKGSCASTNSAKTLTKKLPVHLKQHNIEQRKKNKEKTLLDEHYRLLMKSNFIVKLID